MGFWGQKTSWDQLQPVFFGLEDFEMMMDQRPDRGYGLDRSWEFPVLIGYGSVWLQSFSSLVTGLSNTSFDRYRHGLLWKTPG